MASSHDNASDEKAGGTSSSSSSSIPHVKFPRTTHIFDAGGSGVTRDDLVLSKGDAKVFYSGLVVGVVSEGHSNRNWSCATLAPHSDSTLATRLS